MRGLSALAFRELLGLWATPLGWVLLTAFLGLQGAAFASVVASMVTLAELDLDLGITQAFFGQSVFVPMGLMILCPALTMRSFAEERRSGTLDTLLAAPVPALHIVLGKFAAAWVSYVLIWSPTVLYPAILRHTGHIEWGVVATSYLAILAAGTSLLALGVLASTLTRSQLVSLVLSSATVFLLILSGIMEQVLDEGWLRELCSHLSLQRCLEEASQGILSLRRMTFHASLTVLSLFVATRRVDHWRTAP